MLSPGELKQIRRDVEGFDAIDLIEDEMRELWPDRAGKLPVSKAKLMAA